MDYYRNLHALKRQENEDELKEIRYKLDLGNLMRTYFPLTACSAKKNTERTKQKQREDLLLTMQKHESIKSSQGNPKKLKKITKTVSLTLSLLPHLTSLLGINEEVKLKKDKFI